MVQSLIPIWDVCLHLHLFSIICKFNFCSSSTLFLSLLFFPQEEYERTGVHETVNLFKDGKPPPESILRNFLDRPGNEFAYSSFLTKVEVPSPPKVYTPDAEGTPDLKPSTNMKSSMSHTNDTLNPTRESPLVNYDHNLHFQGERSSNHLLSATRRALLADSTNIGASMVLSYFTAHLFSSLFCKR